MKKKLANLILMLSSIGFTFVLFNALFPLLIQQSVFPRALLQYVGHFQSTYYPQTFNRGELQNYTAILGDSYAEGAGDPFLNGEHDYSFAHQLRAATGRDYVTFARSGFCSTTSAKEMLRVQSIAEKNPLLTNFSTPGEMFFFFYEGNDLNDNLRYLNYVHAEQDDERRAEIKADILSGSTLKSSDYLDAWLPFNGLITGAYELLRDGHDTMLSQPSCETCSDHTSSLQHLANTVPLQSAAAELSTDKLKQALDVFFVSIDTLTEMFPDTQLTVVYLPSPISSYPFHGNVEKVRAQSYQSRKPFIEIDPAHNQRQHETIVESMSAGLKLRGVDFLNTTAAIQAAAKSELMHGPKDVKHFNATASQLVTELILDYDVQKKELSLAASNTAAPATFY